MKKVLSISLGTSKRDSETIVNIAGDDVELIRKGTNGNVKKAVELFEKYDGKVDAFGLGGAISYLDVNNKKYYFRQLKQINKVVKKSKMGDGNRIKGILSENAFEALKQEGISLSKQKILHMGGIDRYKQALYLHKHNCDIVFGDLIFGIGIPVPIKKLSTLNTISAIILPVVTQLPFRWFYPVGDKQDREPSGKFIKYFEKADIIVGDYIWIKTHLPPDLKKKIVVTNTTTKEDCDEMKKRGLKLLVTTTPRLGTRSFGTNVMEAMLLACIDKTPDKITKNDFLTRINNIPIRPNLEYFN